MFRIKMLMAALLCLLVPFACAESPNLISEDMMRDEAVHYKTAAVEMGTFERMVSTSASEYYPVEYQVRFEGSGARFGEYLVERRDAVKKGDVLATFEVDFDEAAYLEAQLKLERLQDEAVRAEENAGEEMEQLEMQLLKATSSEEKALARLHIERAEIVRAQAKDSFERQIAAMEDQIAEMEQQKNAVTLIAPIDGEVQSIETRRAGEKVYEGEVLVTIRQENVVLMAIENPAGAYRYGAELSVEVGSGKDKTQLEGRVVAVDTVAPVSERKGYALAEVYNPDGVKLKRMTVTEAMIRVDNVMMVPRKAVSMDGGKYCVQLLKDGVPQKRFINCVFSNTAKTVWVIQGLELGDEVVVD